MDITPTEGNSVVQRNWNHGFGRPSHFKSYNPLTINQVVRTAALRKLMEGLDAGAGPFPTKDISFAEDWVMWARLLSQGSWGLSLPEPLIWIRKKRARRWKDTATNAATAYISKLAFPA